MEKLTRWTVIAIFFALSLVIPGMSLAADAGDVQIHGFVSQGYLYTGDNQFLADTEAGSFEFNEAGVNFTAEPVEKLRIGVQLFSRDLGDIDNNRVDLDWAFADYRWRDELGIRIGRVKTPYGLSMESMDLDMSRTTIFLPLAVYEPRYRSVSFAFNGLNLYGSAKFGPLGGIDYSFFIGTNSNPKEAMEPQFVGLMEPDSISVRLLYGGRITWNTPLKGLLFGGSYMELEGLKATGDLLPVLTAPIAQLGGLSIYPAGTKVTFSGTNILRYNLFTQFSIEKFTFTGEYTYFKADAVITTDQPYDPFVAALIGFKGIEKIKQEPVGWYTQADYQFVDWFTAAVAYSQYYYDVNDMRGHDVEPHHVNYQYDTTVSLRFDINKNWNVKLETHFMDGTALVTASDRYNIPDDLEKNWTLYAVKTSFYF